MSNKHLTIPKIFMLAGLIILSAGLLFGLTGALQYIVPGFLKQFLSFEKTRPLHVSAILFWIITGSSGAVFSYLQQSTGKKIYSVLLAKIQCYIFSACIVLIFISYCIGIFGGREYWEFPPALGLPIAIAWVLFLFNYLKSVSGFKNQPVYVWMWLTGIVFFLFTFLESYLWIFPYFRNNIVNDMTIQWKSYGSMVGSWNMLIYGSSIFLMEKIMGVSSYSRTRLAFLMYFLGLFNLMFNWGHHIYTLPTHNYIKHVSYIVSMTELLIFGKIIYQWKSSLDSAKKYGHYAAYSLLLSADAWVFLTLALSILMSVPAINVYTHGTHFTVAHAMGATIGINSLLLLAFASDILMQPPAISNKKFKISLWTVNIALFVFWISLIAAGIQKARWQMSTEKIPFSVMMLEQRPIFIIFFIAGLVLTIGLLLIIYPLIKWPLMSSDKTGKQVVA